MAGDGACAPITAPRILWHADTYPIHTLRKLVAAKSNILENMGFWFRKSPLLGIRPGEKQSTITLDFLADSRRWASTVNSTLHSFESLSAPEQTFFFFFFFFAPKRWGRFMGTNKTTVRFVIWYSASTQVRNRQKTIHTHTHTDTKLPDLLQSTVATSRTSNQRSHERAKKNAVRQGSRRQTETGGKSMMHKKGTAPPGGQHISRQASTASSRTPPPPSRNVLLRTRQQQNRPLCKHTYCRLRHRCRST